MPRLTLADVKDGQFDISKYKVTCAYLHQAITCPGVTGGEKTINEQKIAGAKLSIVLDNQWLLLEAKGRTSLINAANVASLTLTKREE